jgi:EmrB/QacA subfamily drug resistance transporter
MQIEQKGDGTMNGRLSWVLGLTSLSFFMCVLDSLVVITALPRMQADLHVGLATLQWTVNAYGIAFAAAIITAAALGDRFGRRRVFVGGLTLFTLASAACALAPDASLLIAARTVQGLGGAAVLPLSLTILTGAFPPERRGTIVGIYGGLAGLAVASGPLVGGALTQGIDWHWIFWANVPLGVVAALASARLLPESFGRQARLDLPGVALVSAAVVGLVWGLVRAPAVGWSSAEVVSAVAGGALLVAAFLVWEARAPEPMLPLRLLRVPAFAAGNASAFLMSGSIFGGAFMVSQYFQLGLGYSPLATGIRLLPFTMTPIVIAPLAGAASDRLGRRPLVIAGLAVQAAGFAWVALRASTHLGLAELLVALSVAGAGASMALPTVPTAVLGAVAPADMGTASGVNNTMQRFGAVFAVAIATSVFAAYGHLGSPAGITDGFRPAVGVSALLALLGAAAAVALERRARGQQLAPATVDLAA